MPQYSVIKKVETQTASISLCDDGLVRVMLKKDAEIDLPKSQENIAAYLELINDKQYAFLFYAEDDSVIYTEEARRNAKQNEAAFDKVCAGVVIKNLAQKIVANFYLKFHQPGYPFKVFTNIEEAERWCLAQYTKHQESEEKINLILRLR
jgi:hypothetical protein